jgi:hypothetical protein
MTTYSQDTDAVGVLITTEFGGPPQNFPAGVPNFQGYGTSGQGVEAVYPYLYNPTVDVPPTDESEGALDLQEQEWVGEVQYLQENDPQFLTGADITADVVFENPLDTVNANAIDVGTNTVDYDRVSDVPSGGPFAYGVSEDAAPTSEATVVVADEQVSATNEVTVEAPAEVHVVAPESAESTEEAAEAVETTEVTAEPVEAPVVAPQDATVAPETTEAEGV